MLPPLLGFEQLCFQFICFVFSIPPSLKVFNRPLPLLTLSITLKQPLSSIEDDSKGITRMIFGPTQYFPIIKF